MELSKCFQVQYILIVISKLLFTITVQTSQAKAERDTYTYTAIIIKIILCCFLLTLAKLLTTIKAFD